MNELVLSLLVIPLASNFISDFSGVMDKVKFWMFYRRYTRKTIYRPFRIKPFDCAMCFSFWVTVFIVTIPQFSPDKLILPFASAAVATIINKLYYL